MYLCVFDNKLVLNKLVAVIKKLLNFLFYYIASVEFDVNKAYGQRW